MGKRKDRERARNGLLFRNGKLIKKEELGKVEEEKTSPEEAARMIEEAMRFAGTPRYRR